MKLILFLIILVVLAYSIYLRSRYVPKDVHPEQDIAKGLGRFIEATRRLFLTLVGR